MYYIKKGVEFEMPLGYTEYFLKKGKSASTVKFEVTVIKQFLGFVSLKYKKSVEPIELLPADVRDFLDLESKKLKASTIYRKQSHLKRFFDYMWRQNIIPFDFMTKFNYFGTPEMDSHYKFSPNDINYDYETILEKKQLILASDLPAQSKLLAVLYVKGIQLIDIYNLTINDFYLKAQDHVELQYVSKFNVKTKIQFIEQEDSKIIRTFIDTAIERGTDYLINAKSKEGEYRKSKPIYSRYYMNRINDYINMPYRSDEIRVTYVDYLYRVKKKSISEISTMIGRQEDGVLYLIRSAGERIK